jgi:hypothetical protein
MRATSLLYCCSIVEVAGCATGSTRPKRCPNRGRASRPLPSFPTNVKHKATGGRVQPPHQAPRHLALIHRSAWKVDFANFGLTAFYEVHV